VDISPTAHLWSAFLARCPAPLIVFERQTGRVLAAAPGAETTLGPPGPARDARLVAAAAAPDDGADFTLSVFEIGDDALCGALIRSQETDEALGRGMLLAELSPLVAHELSQPIATVMNWAEGLRLRLGRLAAQEAALTSLLPAAEAILAQGRRAGELLQAWRRHLRDEPIAPLDTALAPVLERAARHLRAARPDLNVRWPAADADLPAVDADPSLVEVALFGLLRTPNVVGERTVDVRTSTDTSEVVVAVGPAPVGALATSPDLLVTRAAVARCGGELRRVFEGSGPVFHLLLRGVRQAKGDVDDRRPR
jgi:signal transduction histidine kinase